MEKKSPAAEHLAKQRREEEKTASEEPVRGSFEKDASPKVEILEIPEQV